MEARIRMGISKADLAKQLCLSVAHINELEARQLKYFFNHRHRYHTALKLGKLLGLKKDDFVVPAPKLESPPTITSDTISGEIQSPGTVMDGLDLTTSGHSNFRKLNSMPWVSSFKTSAIQQKTQNESVKVCRSKFSVTKSGLMVAGLGALFFASAFLFAWDDDSGLAKQGNSAAGLVLPQGPANDSGSDMQPSQSQAPLAPSASVVGAGSNVANSNIAQVACERQGNEKPVEFTPIGPLKSPNFVFILANQAAALCVQDSVGKISLVNLAANESKVVVGKAPLNLFANDFGNLQIYFQGRKVRDLSQTSHELILNPIALVNQENP